MTRQPLPVSDARLVEKSDMDCLRAAWAEGIASGDDGPLDMAALIEEAKRETSNGQ